MAVAPMSSEEFKKIRKRLGLSQEKLADELGVAQGAVSFWENGQRPIPGPVAIVMRLWEVMK